MDEDEEGTQGGGTPSVGEKHFGCGGECGHHGGHCPERFTPSSEVRAKAFPCNFGWGAFCDSLELDRRLARAVAQLGWTRPSLVQKATLPVALSGRDCLVRARTGSGKTACYALPILQRVLRDKASASDARKAYNGVRALVPVWKSMR